MDLKKEHGEDPTSGLKASLLLEMLPYQVRLTVAQGLSSKKLDYDTLVAKIKLVASVQSDYSTPPSLWSLERWSTMTTTRRSRLSRCKRASC